MKSTLRHWAPTLALVAAGCDQPAPPAPVANNTVTAIPTLTLTDNSRNKITIDVPPDRVTLDGTVISTTPSRLFLDYGSGQVTIDVSDWQSFREGQLIHPGDRIVVTGLADADFFANRMLKARSLYVAQLHTNFFVEGAAAEDLGLGWIGKADQNTRVRYSGVVTEATPAGFTLGTKATRIPIDVSELGYDPLDEDGYQRIVPGQRVFVWGELGQGSGGQNRILASGVVTLQPDASDDSAPAESEPQGNTQAPAAPER